MHKWIYRIWKERGSVQGLQMEIKDTTWEKEGGIIQGYSYQV